MGRRLLLCGAAAIALSGCATGNVGSIRYDSSVANSSGTITLSDPKLYSRETLIIERSRDVAWLDKLIEESGDPTKVMFKPSLYREVELVTVLTASLGLKFDPAAAVANRRADYLSDLQQQYDVMKLKLQLEQLSTDAALFRKKLAEQTEVATPGLGTPGTSTPGTTTATTPPDAAALLTALDTVVTSLNARMAAGSPTIGKTEATSSPIEDFQDRLAYRNMLKAARNTAGLDELQDAGNYRLIRLNFQATVLPDSRYARSLGAVQLRVSGNTSAPEYLSGWLRWTNSGERWRENGNIGRVTIDGLVATGNFEVLRFSPNRNTAPIDILMPALISSPGKDADIRGLFNLAEWSDASMADDRREIDVLFARLGQAPERKQRLRELCVSDDIKLNSVLARAQAREQSRAVAEMVNLVYFDQKMAQPITSLTAKYQLDQSRHATLLKEMATEQACAGIAGLYPISSDLPWKLQSGSAFNLDAKARIYEVGPREQMQQVSSVARSATSLSLAASLAASLPQAGVGASVGAGYRRDLLTRASALDRVPEVVGYSVGGAGTFGWVIGPRATTDEKGRATVEQLLRSYDLSVDLSVPAWWASMDVAVVKTWAPSPQLLVKGALVAADQGGPGETMKVMLPAAIADYQGFTQLLLSDGTRPPEITAPVIGGPVNACAPTTLVIRGRNLWRADRVVLLGTSIGRDAIALASDMQGIVVTVPAISGIIGAKSYASDPLIHVFTPFGTADATFSYQASPSGDDCTSKAKPKPEPKADAKPKADPKPKSKTAAKPKPVAKANAKAKISSPPAANGKGKSGAKKTAASLTVGGPAKTAFLGTASTLENTAEGARRKPAPRLDRIGGQA